MKRTSFRLRQANRFLPERAYMSLPLLEDPPSVLFFLDKKERCIIRQSCREGEREGAREPEFFFKTLPVCHHSGRQRQKEEVDRSVTSRNQLIAQQRNDFRPRQLRCSFAARHSASRSGEVHSDEELIQDTTTSKRRTVQDEGHSTPLSQSSTSLTCTCRPCEL